ncbi:MAG: ABC transporter permease [Clostridia bacterium]|nr:ABC transporter permease [Clostridia bacterium]MBR6786455.1 ABC transporter permease [Clostridia bacterium]
MNELISNLGIILNATLMYTPPLLYAALGSCFSEKSGVVNIGIEGMIVFGGFMGALLGNFIANPWICFLCGGLAGALLALLHAFATVSCRADQTISGTAINFLATGFSVFICYLTFKTSETPPVIEKLPRIFNGAFIWLRENLPEGAAKLFAQNSFLDLVFNTYASTYLAFVLVAVVWFVFYRTRFGLRLRAVGEHPRAADTLGVNVYLVRYLCVIFSGFLAGLGGASITLATVSAFRPSIVAGQGFIAIAAVIFGKFKPQGALLGCILFGFCNGLRVVVGSNSVIPVNLISMIPYVVTILTLVLFVGRAQVPAANGKPYIKSK